MSGNARTAATRVMAWVALVLVTALGFVQLHTSSKARDGTGLPDSGRTETPVEVPVPKGLREIQADLQRARREQEAAEARLEAAEARNRALQEEKERSRRPGK